MIDTDAQAVLRRMELVDQVFTPTSRAFLREQVGRPPALAIDLGCGPGLSTVTLGEVTSARLVAGLDVSWSWITLAQRWRTARRRFFVHDVTTVPFPVGPAELLYGRLLLTHLPDPAAAMAGWVTQLAPRGQLLLEEVEQISTANPIFVQYLELVRQVTDYEGIPLFVGPRLAAMEPGSGLVRLGSRVRPVAVENSQAARVFQANLRGWVSHPVVQAHRLEGAVRELAQALQQMAEPPDERYDTQWSVRQVAYRQE